MQFVFGAHRIEKLHLENVTVTRLFRKCPSYSGKSRLEVFMGPLGSEEPSRSKLYSGHHNHRRRKYFRKSIAYRKNVCYYMTMFWSNILDV